MNRCRELPAGERRLPLNRRDRAGRAQSLEPRWVNNGSIDYDFYRTVAGHLRRDLTAQVTASLVQQAIRGPRLLADWIAALMDDRIPGFKHGR